MTIEELRKSFSNNTIRDIVQKQTNLICDAYQQGWEDCYNLFAKWLKEKGIEL